MGYIRHDAAIAILDHDFDKDQIAAIEALRDAMTATHDDGRGLPNCILGPCTGINGTTTYVFSPDGSKEGWEPSNRCDFFRERFINIAKGARHSSVVHLRMGGDDGETIIQFTTDSVGQDELASLSP